MSGHALPFATGFFDQILGPKFLGLLACQESISIMALCAMCRLMRRNKSCLYSITSSARARIDGGTVRPSVLAVLRLTASSTFVDSCTGKCRLRAPSECDLRMHRLSDTHRPDLSRNASDRHLP